MFNHMHFVFHSHLKVVRITTFESELCRYCRATVVTAWSKSKMHFCKDFIVILVICMGCVECHQCNTEEKNHDAACPTYWASRGNFCYRFYSTEMTWVDAEAFCNTIGAPNGQGIAHLLSVHSADEQKWLYDYWKSHRNETPTNVS
ncbi:Echinoidin [Holothuria leucospilota]|uniref:Echinoidin n=1 Tax=Holothuria leucospilota TaxID=206669 RepID=A0A9Q0YCY6_HOLLE|nr:Echinoidin [Holothuria leucospilota]